MEGKMKQGRRVQSLQFYAFKCGTTLKTIVSAVLIICGRATRNDWHFIGYF